jgi:hypothetical protein
MKLGKAAAAAPINSSYKDTATLDQQQPHTQDSSTTLAVEAAGRGPVNRGPPILFVAIVADEIIDSPRAGCLPVVGKTLGQAGFEAMHAVSE